MNANIIYSLNARNTSMNSTLPHYLTLYSNFIHIHTCSDKSFTNQCKQSDTKRKIYHLNIIFLGNIRRRLLLCTRIYHNQKASDSVYIGILWERPNKSCTHKNLWKSSYFLSASWWFLLIHHNASCDRRIIRLTFLLNSSLLSLHSFCRFWMQMVKSCNNN